MSEIKAILIRPEDGDPHGLLREGTCGARPPIAYIPNRGWKWTEGPCAEEYPNGRALVLAWDGEPVAEGCLRVGWRDSVFTFWRSVSESIEGGATALAWLRQHCVDHNLGSLVLLDAEGREVSDE